MSKEGDEYIDCPDKSYEETRKIINENGEKKNTLKFHLSNQRKNNDLNLDEPTSKGDLEEELSGP